MKDGYLDELVNLLEPVFKEYGIKTNSRVDINDGLYQLWIDWRDEKIQLAKSFFVLDSGKPNHILGYMLRERLQPTENPIVFSVRQKNKMVLARKDDNSYESKVIGLLKEAIDDRDMSTAALIEVKYLGNGE